MTTPRTLRLTERLPVVARLSRDDAAFLRRHYRHALSVTPYGRRGDFLVTSRGHVGTVVAPSLRLVLLPKLPAGALLRLLDPDAPPGPEDDGLADPATGPADWLVRRLAARMVARAEAGLPEDYAEDAATGPELRGKLDLPAQLRDPLAAVRFHSRFDIRTPDVPCNRLVRGTADALLASSGIGEGARAALRQALTGYAGIAPLEPTPDQFDAAEADPVAVEGRPLLRLCRLAAEAIAPVPSPGEVACPAFLVNLERAFERYVGAGLSAATTDGAFLAQPVRAFAALADGPVLRVRPDFLLTHADRPTCVVDVKWKRLSPGGPRPDDLHQALAYALLLEVPRTVLVYPARRDHVWDYVLESGKAMLQIRALRVTGSRARCERSLQRLGRELCGVIG